jgi:hypothetical protein
MVESSKTAKQRCSENSSILKIFGRNLVEAENNLKTVESLLTKQTE